MLQQKMQHVINRRLALKFLPCFLMNQQEDTDYRRCKNCQTKKICRGTKSLGVLNSSKLQKAGHSSTIAPKTESAVLNYRSYFKFSYSANIYFFIEPNNECNIPLLVHLPEYSLQYANYHFLFMFL